MREIGEAEIFEYCVCLWPPELDFFFVFLFGAFGNRVAMAMAMARAMDRLGADFGPFCSFFF